jgi:hypothetical protein
MLRDRPPDVARAAGDQRRLARKVDSPHVGGRVFCHAEQRFLYREHAARVLYSGSRKGLPGRLQWFPGTTA